MNLVDSCTFLQDAEKGSRICMPCNVLDVQKYVLVSMVSGYNGPHFIADLMRDHLLLVGVKHCLTLAYCKKENTIVERYHKEINRHLRALTYDNSSLIDYKKSLPFVRRITAID